MLYGSGFDGLGSWGFKVHASGVAGVFCWLDLEACAGEDYVHVKDCSCA